MSKEKLYTAPRWTDIPWGREVDCPQPTDEEKKQLETKGEAFFRKMGIIKEDEKIEDFRIK